MPITDAMQKLIGVEGAEVTSQFTTEEKPIVSTGQAIGFAFFSLLILIIVVGVITEYTSLFNKYNAKESASIEESKSKIGLLFLSFSFTRNIRKIFWGPPAKEGDYLVIFNGVRILSILYVILGHGFTSIFQVPFTEIEGLDRLLGSWGFYIITGGVFAVDVFFFLSAFLGSYLMLLKFYTKRNMNIPLIYFHRIYRLVIPIAFVIALFLTFMIFLGDGPVWNTSLESQIEGCREQWWETLLFIGNLIPYNTGMKWLNWLWYIQNDMQFFLLLPFQIWLYKKHRYLGYSLAYFILIGSCITSFIISAVNKMSINVIAEPNYWVLLYMRPWARINAYQVGVIFGMYYYEWMNRSKIRIFVGSFGTSIFELVYNFRFVRYSFYIIGFILINLIMIGGYVEGTKMIDAPQHFSQFFHDLYNAFARPLFVLWLMLILAGPLTGRNRFLRWFLGSSGYNPWARVSFMVYLIHLLVFSLFYCQIRQSVSLDTKQIP